MVRFVISSMERATRVNHHAKALQRLARLTLFGIPLKQPRQINKMKYINNDQTTPRANNKGIVWIVLISCAACEQSIAYKR